MFESWNNVVIVEKKLFKIFGIWKISWFLSFSVSIWNIFNQNITTISSLKTTGQRIVSFWHFKTVQSKKTVETSTKMLKNFEN